MLTIIYNETQGLNKIKKRLHNIGQTNYTIRNINDEPLTTKEISFITQYYDIISLFRNNNWRQKYLYSLNHSTIKGLINIIQTHPKRVRTPILLDMPNNKVLVGMNTDDIHMFVPKELRKLQLEAVL